MRKLLVVLLLVVGVSGAGAATDPLDTWHWRNPSPQGNPLHGVCFGDEEFVAVGANGTVMTSPDGEAWLNQESGTRITLNGVTHAAGRFVAVGEFGLILYSDDARVWQSADSPWFYHLNAVTWGEGLFVAVGEDSAILTSPDGMTWTLRVTGSEPLNDVAYGGGKFLSVGGRHTGGTVNNPTAPTQIMITSENGINWEARHPGFPGILTAAHYWKNEFYVGIWPSSRNHSYVLSSADMVSWLPSSGAVYSAAPIQCFVGDESSLFAFMGNSSIVVYAPIETTDGQMWVSNSSPPTGGYPLAAVGALERMVAVGTSFSGVHSRVRSSDGMWREVNWLREIPGRIAQGSDMAGGLITTQLSDGRYRSHLAFTTNGFHWRSNYIAEATFDGLTFANGKFVAWQNADKILAWSEDAYTWQTLTNLPSPPVVSLQGGNGVWLVITGQPMLPGSHHETYWRSENLVEWEELPSPTGASVDPHALGFGYDRFLLVNAVDRESYTSQDGLDWTAHAFDLETAAFRVHFAEDRWLGVDDRARGFVSNDGLNWVSLGPFGGNLWLSDLTHAAGYYVATVGVGINGFLMTSSDEGTTWIPRYPGDSTDWARAMVAFNSVIAWSWGGWVAQSAPLNLQLPVSMAELRSIALPHGGSVTLNGTVYGSPPLTHEWYRDGLLVAGANEPLLAVRNLAEGAAHEYTLVTSTAYGSVTNGPARVVVGQPATLGIATGAPFGGTLAGTAGLTYRVDYRDGSPAEGTWRTLTNLTLVGPSGTFVDQPPTNRFYRAELVP